MAVDPITLTPLDEPQAVDLGSPLPHKRMPFAFAKRHGWWKRCRTATPRFCVVKG